MIKWRDLKLKFHLLIELKRVISPSAMSISSPFCFFPLHEINGKSSLLCSAALFKKKNGRCKGKNGKNNGQNLCEREKEKEEP